MTAVGILQGRLSEAAPGRAQVFPWATWRDEFAIARGCGLHAIEWLVTAAGIDRNPLCAPDGVADIRRLCMAYGMRVSSVCLDAFIELPLVGLPSTERTARLRILGDLIPQAAAVGASTIVLPMLEGNRWRDRADADEVLAALAPALDRASRAGVRLAVESDWPAAALAERLLAVDHAALGVCYDVGNAVTYGLPAAEDVRELSRWLRAVHIKDRRGAVGVHLGDGDADIAAVLETLMRVGYDGTLVLETPRGDHPVRSATANASFVRALLNRRPATTR